MSQAISSENLDPGTLNPQPPSKDSMRNLTRLSSVCSRRRHAQTMPCLQESERASGPESARECESESAQEGGRERARGGLSHIYTYIYIYIYIYIYVTQGTGSVGRRAQGQQGIV